MEALRIVRVKAGPEVARPARMEALPQRQQTRRKKMFSLLLHNNLVFFVPSKPRHIAKMYFKGRGSKLLWAAKELLSPVVSIFD